MTRVQIVNGIRDYFAIKSENKYIAEGYKCVQNHMDLPNKYPSYYYTAFEADGLRELKPQLNIYQIAVDENLRRLGYGVKIFQELLKECFARGCEGRITVDSALFKSNIHPNPFYYKIGFMHSPSQKIILPDCDTFMHLPKENIEFLRNYGNS
ncbi:MAG: GNAT family N-acetyltransferase [Heliobacteriaceae bacterium]|jgi:GNAT superfamily N-acetyltransferase|nr:GNAT family N-acetyltransferase [Heliobacteriaceae bacterium]